MYTNTLSVQLVRLPILHLMHKMDNDFFCPNILEDQAQWRDKTKGLSKQNKGLSENQGMNFITPKQL